MVGTCQKAVEHIEDHGKQSGPYEGLGPNQIIAHGDNQPSKYGQQVENVYRGEKIK